MAEEDEKKLLDVKIGNLKEVNRYSYDLTISKKALREDFESQGKKVKSFREWLKVKRVFRFYRTPTGLVIEITSAEEE